MGDDEASELAFTWVAEACRAVETDVAVDANVDLTYELIRADWPGCLIYPGSVRPSPPYALFDPYREYTHRAFTPAHSSQQDITWFVANEVQTLVHLDRWRQGLDPTWPPCRAHAGRHPLAVRDEGHDPHMGPGRLVWACMAHETPTLGGSVAESAYVVEIGRWPGFDSNS